MAQYRHILGTNGHGFVDTATGKAFNDTDESVDALAYAQWVAQGGVADSHDAPMPPSNLPADLDNFSLTDDVGTTHRDNTIRELIQYAKLPTATGAQSKAAIEDLIRMVIHLYKQQGMLP